MRMTSENDGQECVPRGLESNRIRGGKVIIIVNTSDEEKSRAESDNIQQSTILPLTVFIKNKR